MGRFPVASCEWQHGFASPSLLRKHDPGSGPLLRELELRRPSSVREAWRLGREPEVFEDLAHDQAIGQERDPFAQSAAMRTGQDVDRECAQHELGPGRARAALGLASTGRGSGLRARLVRLFAVCAIRRTRRPRHDELAPYGRRRQHAVVRQQVRSRPRHERREPGQEVELGRAGRRPPPTAPSSHCALCDVRSIAQLREMSLNVRDDTSVPEIERERT